MGEMREYKCPACGGTVEFDAKLQKMKCPYCDTEFEIEDFEEPSEEGADVAENKEGDDAAGIEGDSLEVDESVDWNKGDTEEWTGEDAENMRVYCCQSCGGEIIADETTGASICPFCGNRVVIKGKFSGDLKPDYIIPFKLEKRDAKAAYLKHLEGKSFLPLYFREDSTIDEIRGVYVPFWLFDAEVDGQVSYRAENYRVWRDSKREYTETSVYNIERGGHINFDNIPADGSLKMDDSLMESIEPYDFKDAVPFKSAYLAGYMADRYDVDVESRVERVKERIINSTKMAFEETVTGYDSVRATGSNITIKDAKHKYALYPVWILNTTWKGEKFTFAMNGQTGKLVGNLPLDKGKFWGYVATRGLLFSAVLVAATVAFLMF